MRAQGTLVISLHKGKKQRSNADDELQRAPETEIEGDELDFEHEETEVREEGTAKAYVAEHTWADFAPGRVTEEYEDDEDEWNEQEYTVTVTVWEYPVGVYNSHQIEWEGGRVKVLQDNLTFDFA